MGNVFKDQDRLEGAIEAYQKAISFYEQTLKMGQHSAALYYNLGNANYRLNKVAESVYYFEKAMLMRPKTFSPITHRGLTSWMTLSISGQR